MPAPKLLLLPLLLLILLHTEGALFAQPLPCCETASCHTCEDIAACMATPFIMPEFAAPGGSGVCGFPGPVQCSTWWENNTQGVTNGDAASPTNPDGCVVCGPGDDIDGDYLCDSGATDFTPADQCYDLEACNYDDPDNGACVYPDACGFCDGSGVDVDGDGICDDIDNCTDTIAFTYANAANIECLYYGCVNPTADNYDPDPSTFGCQFGIDLCCIWNGCTDGSWSDGTPPACNYDTQANVDDGSCEYDSCAGCTDVQACNHDATATIDDGGCDYSCSGCTDPCSANYDPTATLDDGSCQSVLGCTDQAACNYDACANWNYGCQYVDACGICGGPGAIYECGCSDIPEGDCDCEGNQLNGCGVCGGGCILDLDEDGICDDEEVLGCTYPAACNLDPAATQDDGSCLFPQTGYDCGGNCLEDADGDGICDGDELAGCTDNHALNYYPYITEEDGSCIYIEDFAVDCTVDCPDDCPFDVNFDGVVSVTDILQVLSAFGYICP